MKQAIRSMAEIDATEKLIKVKIDDELLPFQARELAKRLCALADIIDEKEARAVSDEEARWGPGPPRSEDDEE